MAFLGRRCFSLAGYDCPSVREDAYNTARETCMFRRFKKAPETAQAPVYECGYAYPHHSQQPHYHVGHPRKKTQSMTKGSGPYDGDVRYANTGVPPNPPGTPNPPLARGQ
jgi:hypothetical protein